MRRHWERMLYFTKHGKSDTKDLKLEIFIQLAEDDRSDAQKKFDNGELEELFNENPIQTQEKLAERLGVRIIRISIRLKQLDKIQKLEQ